MKFIAILAAAAAVASAAVDMEDANAVQTAFDTNGDGYIADEELDNLMSAMEKECDTKCPGGLNVADFDAD